MKQLWQNISFHTKMLALAAVVFVAGLFLVLVLNREFAFVLQEASDTYDTNRQIVEAQKELAALRQELTDYLDSSSRTSREDYDKFAEQWRQTLAGFNQENTPDEALMMEKDIYHMAQDYLDLADQAIACKEIRDIDQYQSIFSDLEVRYRYLHDLMSSLNTRRLEENTVSYNSFSHSSDVAREGNLILVLLLGVLGILTFFLLNRISNNEIRERGVVADNQVKDAELKYLRAQINPHFLFNTLNAGTQLAMMEGADRTYDYLHKVAKFYRYTARQNAKEISVAQEIESIDDYMYIIQVRYSGSILYEKQIDSTHMDMLMPGMTLQPIVENCIKHGFADAPGEKRILLSVYDKEDEVCISVADSGVGISEERLAQVRAQTMDEPIATDPSDREGEGIGVPSIRERLRMFYDQEDILEIIGKGALSGAEIVLHLPLKQSQPKEKARSSKDRSKDV